MKKRFTEEQMVKILRETDDSPSDLGGIKARMAKTLLFHQSIFLRRGQIYADFL